MERITWDKPTEEKFLKILEQIPDMVRGIAETRINKKIEAILREAGQSNVTEKVMIDAFFAETPPPFFGMMKAGMDEVGIDYTQYGYAK